MSSKKGKEYLTTVEAAEVLLVSTATVRQWAQKGELRAQNTPGGHRRFFIEDIEYFAKTKGIDIHARYLGRGSRILIVDDDEKTQKLLTRVLGKEIDDIEINTASNGFEAGQLLAQFKPSIVILDIMMPGISGIDVCKLIRSNPDTRNVNIIAITGHYTEDNVASILKAGANVCLSKPIEIGELLSALHLNKEGGATIKTQQQSI